MPRKWFGPADDPYVRVLHAIDEELDTLALPAGPARRRLEAPASSVVTALRGMLASSLDAVVARRTAPSYAVNMGASTVANLGITLFVCGAPHSTWRRWTALSAVSRFLVGDWCAAVTLGAIAREWKLVDAIDHTQEELDAGWGALWRLLGKTPHAVITSSRDTEQAISVWDALVTAAADEPTRSRSGFEWAFMRVVDHASASDDRLTDERVRTGDPHGESFRPTAWSAEAESGVAAAAAAILKRRGWIPSAQFGEQRLRFLEPGLADGPSSLGAERFLPCGPHDPQVVGQ